MKTFFNRQDEQDGQDSGREKGSAPVVILYPDNPVNPVNLGSPVFVFFTRAFYALVGYVPVFFVVIWCLPVSAQIQQAWVAKYNNGIPNGMHQDVKMALDTNGNIYVTGFSQNTNGNLGYATIKYAPNGNQGWVARYDTTNTPSAKPAGLALDKSNNVIVTGSALTVKYDANGNQLWTAPYAGGALAVDTNANVILTGCGTNLNTVKLNPLGSNLWSQTYADVGPTLSQVVLTDSNGNVYVSGQDAWYFLGYYYETQIITIKYDSTGDVLWRATNRDTSGSSTDNVKGAAVDIQGNFIVAINILFGNPLGYDTIKYASNNGDVLWASSYNTQYSVRTDSRVGISYGLALDRSNNVFLTGQGLFEPGSDQFLYAYETFKLDTNGVCLWTNIYPQPMAAMSAATAITVDGANNVYVTGYSPGTNSGNDIVTIKYDNNGNQIWLQRYNGPGNGDDEANAIAVDAGGNVYVTGYETTAAGGTEMVTIKYAPGPFLTKQANGNFLLQAVGAVGESFDFQATTDFLTWLNLGTNTADSNGAVWFLDTNAPLFNYRFYKPIPQ